MESNNSVGKEEIKAGDKWLEYIKQFPNLELAFKNCLSETQQLWFAQQIDIFANKYPQPPSPQSAVENEVQAEWEFLTIIRANRAILKNADSKVAFPNHTAKSAALEVYDDMIEIISHLPAKRSGKEKEVADYVNNLSQPQSSVGVEEIKTKVLNQIKAAFMVFENTKKPLNLIIDDLNSHCVAAMTEYSSLMNKEKDREIEELKYDKTIRDGAIENMRKEIERLNNLISSENKFRTENNL